MERIENNLQPEKDPVENIYKMEAGRLKERLIETIKIIPGTMADLARIYLVALQSLGLSEEESQTKLKGITGNMIQRANEARGRADETFEKKSEKLD